MSVAVTPRRTLRPPKVAEKLSIGLSTMWMRAKNDPTFPKPFKLGPRITVFFEDEIDAYLTALANQARNAKAA